MQMQQMPIRTKGEEKMTIGEAREEIVRHRPERPTKTDGRRLQVAIDTIIEFLDVIPRNRGCTGCMHLSKAITAEPCMDCNHGNRWEKKRTGEWIRSKDRLPEPRIDVLVYSRKSGIFFTDHITAKTYRWRKHSKDHTEWCYLPETYEKKEE